MIPSISPMHAYPDVEQCAAYWLGSASFASSNLNGTRFSMAHIPPARRFSRLARATLPEMGKMFNIRIGMVR